MKPASRPSVPLRAPLACAAGFLLAAVATVGLPANAVALAASESYAMSSSIDLGGTPPYAIAVDPASHTAYVLADYPYDTLLEVDTVTHAIVGTVAMKSPGTAIALDPATHTAYVSNLYGGTVSVVDLAAKTVTSTIDVGDNLPYGIAFDAARHTAYVALQVTNTVDVIDTTTDTVTGSIPVGSGPQDVAVDEASGRAYVTNQYDGSLSVIDVATDVVVDTIHTGGSPTAVAVDAAGHTAWVTGPHEKLLWKIDTASDAVVDTIGLGTDDVGVAVDPSAHRVYVASTDGAGCAPTVSVFDTTTDALITTVNAASHNSVQSVAVDPITHSAYVADANGHAVRQIAATTRPIVQCVTPAAGPVAGGQRVTITGADFTGATAVQVGARHRDGTRTDVSSFTVDSATQITATLPAHDAGAYHLYVRTPRGTSAATATDVYRFEYQVPTITGVAPNSGPATGGTTVTITGTGFTGATKVLVGSATRDGSRIPVTSYTVDSDTKITAVMPSVGTTGTVRNLFVATPAGTSAAVAADRFTFLR